MPEKLLTIEEHEKVLDWIKGQGGGWRHSFNEETMGSGVYDVGTEPLMIHGWSESQARVHGVRYSIFCSEKHAAGLEQAGVIKFSPESQQGAKTP